MNKPWHTCGISSFRMCDMTHLYVCITHVHKYTLYQLAVSHKHEWAMTHLWNQLIPYVWHDSFTCTCDMTHWLVRVSHILRVCPTSISRVTHAWISHDTPMESVHSVCVAWLIYMYRYHWLNCMYIYHTRSYVCSTSISRITHAWISHDTPVESAHSVCVTWLIYVYTSYPMICILHIN